jgi:GMP synthase (glutamine-hydrolysing)
MNNLSEKNLKTTNMILILDFGSQVTQLIARRIRELGVFCEVKNFNISQDEINKISPRAIILSGGPASVFEENAPIIDKNIFNLNLPIFGICYGEQLICHLLGGKVEKSFEREFGKAEINIIENSPLLSDIVNKQVWMSHGDHISKIPDGFKAIATTPKAPYAVIANEQKKIYGAQFHPEVVHSLDGKNILKNFVIKIAGCVDDWSMKNFKDQEIANIKKIVGQKKVICGLSGGVDSSVTASLIDQAIGSQLTCIFVDHGLLRMNEGQEVREIFSKNFTGDFIYVDARDLFLKNLSKVSDPEQKRKIIGKTFIEIFDQEASKIKGAEFLAQGTLYPDVIESSHPNDGISQTIKSHHNVGGLPENMQLKLLEPLRMLFKDEVRNLGRQLNLPQKLIGRHPFPGPGLAIRIIGEISIEKIQILQEADNIFIEEIRQANLYDEIWQAFCVLLPIKTVGVMGDARTYENVLALRAVNSIDGMTAEVYNFEAQFLCKVSNRIINEVRGINRVVYDYTSKPPGTIEWE